MWKDKDETEALGDSSEDRYSVVCGSKNNPVWTVIHPAFEEDGTLINSPHLENPQIGGSRGKNRITTLVQ